jgi:hypothetical protein
VKKIAAGIADIGKLVRDIATPSAQDLSFGLKYMTPSLRTTFWAGAAAVAYCSVAVHGNLLEQYCEPVSSSASV